MRTEAIKNRRSKSEDYGGAEGGETIEGGGDEVALQKHNKNN